MKEIRLPGALLAAALMLPAAAAKALTGAEVIAEAQARNGFSTWHDRRSVVTIRGIEGEAGVSRDMEVYERTEPRGEQRTRMAFLSGGDYERARFLHVSPRGRRDMWWTWSPAFGHVRKLGGTAGGLQRDEIFFGADMSYRDLEALVRVQQWTGAEATIALEGDDACAEATCDRVAVVPVEGNDEFPYRRYRLWFSRDDRLLRKAEIYQPAERLMKTITCGDYFASGRFVTARRCSIEHVNGTRSLITVKEVQYDGGLSDDLFTISHLPN